MIIVFSHVQVCYIHHDVLDFQNCAKMVNNAQQLHTSS